MIPFAYDPTAEQSFSVSVGQNIYTPEATDRFDLIVEDRPYAGLMYLSFGVQNKLSLHLHSWEIAFGIIGPASYAADAQEWLHERTGSDPANGWDNQLENEPTLDISFETKWRLYRTRVTERTSLDIISHIGGRLGNVSIYANTGLEIRYGVNLPTNFGICTIRGGCETNPAFPNNHHPAHKSFHIFTLIDGRAVAHDISLDGNSLTDSHSVDKKTFVGDLAIGFAFTFGQMKATYTHTMRTREFDGQNHSPDFGSISLSLSY